MKQPMSRNREGILAVFGCCLAVFWPGVLTFGLPGVMAPLWQTMFDVGRAATGMAVFFMLAAVGVFMFLVGRWQERYGMRRMIALGVILTALGTVFVAFAQSIAMIYAWAFLNGIASCFVYIPALTTVQYWFPWRKGLASGVVSMVFGISAAIMSPLLGTMLKSQGYQMTILTIAILTLAVGLIGALFSRAPGSNGTAGTKSDESIKSHLASETPIVENGSLSVQESLHTRSFWFLWITWTLAGAAGVSMTLLSTAYGLYKGFALESAILILTAFNLTNGLSRLVSGYFSDKVGRNRIMSLTFLAAGFAYFILPFANGLAACALLAAVVGFAFGTLFSVSAPLVVDCFGLKHFGAIFGLSFAAYGFIAGPLGPALSGYLLDKTGGNFLPVFLYLGIFFVISSLCIRFVVKPRLRRGGE